MKYVLILWLAGTDGFLDRQDIYLPHDECHTLERIFENMVPHNKSSERDQIRQLYYHGHEGKPFLAFEPCKEA